MRLFARLSWTEAKLFIRDPLAVIFTFAFPFFALFVLGGVFGNEVEPEGTEDFRIWRGVGPSDYYTPAYVGLVMASVGFVVIPLRITYYRERGILRRYRAAGFPVASFVASQIVVGLALSVAGGIAVIVTSWTAYGALLPRSWDGLLAAWALGLVTFAAVGVALGAVIPTSRAAQGAGLILFFVSMFISGAGPPRGVLTDSMRAFSETLPLTHVILMLQAPWLDSGWDWGAAAAVLGFMAGSTVVALRWFRWG